MKIAAIHYTKLPPECDNIKQNLFDLTEFRMQGPLHNLEIIVSDNISNTLKSITDKFDWAVIVATGNYFHQQKLIIDTVEHAVKNNSPLACHIIQKGGYFYFHPQWFAIDLKAWRSVGNPRFEDSRGYTFTTTIVDRSVENFHDEYTPHWIRPGTGETSYTIDHGYYGTEVVKSFIEAGYTIVNIPNEIRYEKFYSYPEGNFKLIEQIIADPDSSLPEQTPIYWFHEQIRMLKKNLDIGYYPVNTEKIISDRPINEPLDCFIGVCGGLKPVYLAGADNYAEDTTVYLIDVSTAALEYQKYLIENWDGNLKNFQTLFETFRNNHPNYRPTYLGEIGITANLAWSLNNEESEYEEFRKRWQKYKKYKFNFVNINLLEEETPRTLRSWTDQSKLGTYLWLSNSFYMDYLTFYRTRAGSKKLEETLHRHLITDNKSLIIFDSCGSITKHYSVPK